MEIIPITMDEFTDVHQSMCHVHQHYVSASLVAYSGAHSAIGEITITSDPLQCLLLIQKAANKPTEAVLSQAA